MPALYVQGVLWMAHVSPKRACAPKQRYASYDEAALVLVDCKIRHAFRRNQKRREVRVYYCHECNGFHLTSNEDRRAG